MPACTHTRKAIAPCSQCAESRGEITVKRVAPGPVPSTSALYRQQRAPIGRKARERAARTTCLD